MKSALKLSFIFKILHCYYRQLYKKSVCFSFKRQKNNYGQAVFEYVLMLVVTLSLIIGLAVHFITPLGDYLKNNVGAYIECLLETGQVPFILASSPNNECDINQLQATRIPDMNGMTGGGGGSTSGGNGSGDGNDSNRNSNSRSGNNNGNQNANNANRGGGSNGPVLNANGGLSESGGSGGGGAGDSGGSGSNRGSKLVAKLNAETGDGGITRGGSIPYKFQQDMGRGISGVVPVAKTKEEEQLQSVRNPTSPPSTKRENQVERLRKRGFSVPVPPPQKVAGMDTEGYSIGFEFGKYLRYMLIGGIIFALVLMVFMQLNSLRKNITGGG